MNLDEIRAANEQRKAVRAKATQGEWEVAVRTIWTKDGDIAIVDSCVHTLASYCEDLTFIAYAANDNAAATIDVLLAEIERLKREREGG